MINFQCPSCQTQMSAPLDQVGKAENCPKCDLLVAVPVRPTDKPRLPYGDSIHYEGGGIAVGVIFCLIAFFALWYMVVSEAIEALIGAVIFIGASIGAGNAFMVASLIREIRRLRWEQANRPAAGV